MVATKLLFRLEHVALVLFCLVLATLHAYDINWFRFVVAFVILDLIGYIPGLLIARKREGYAAPINYFLYNITHSYLTGLAVIGVWGAMIGGPEWAMLAIPIHLSGDRGIFGNSYKEVSRPFEPMLAKHD